MRWVEVVCLHGAASRAGTWDRLRAELERRRVESHAFTALMVAAAMPGLVDCLVLEEPPVPPRGLNDARPFTRGSELWMRLAAPFARRRLDPRLLHQVLNQLLVPQPVWWDSLARIKAPNLIVASGPTSHICQERLKMLADALPEARLVTVPAGHRVHTKGPDQFIDCVVPFLTRNAPTSSS